MTHKKCKKPEDDIYELLQVGSAINQDLGYLRDDAGDNISDLNPYFGELTGFYWLWKNVSDVEIIGTCHYRRYFGIDGSLLSFEDCEKLIEDADIICSNIVSTDGKDYKSYFSEAHNEKDLLLVGEAINELYPEDVDAFNESLEGTGYRFGNLCLMKKKTFDEYCEWMFNIFTWMLDKVDFTGYDTYHKRLFGFLSENLIRVFAKSRNLKVFPVQVYLTDEKAETKELKLAVFQLLKEQRVKEAKELLVSYVEYRPDVLISLSDISGELNSLISIINYIYTSKDNGIFEHMNSLEELITFYRSIK